MKYTKAIPVWFKKLYMKVNHLSERNVETASQVRVWLDAPWFSDEQCERFLGSVIHFYHHMPYKWIGWLRMDDSTNSKELWLEEQVNIKKTISAQKERAKLHQKALYEYHKKNKTGFNIKKP